MKRLILAITLLTPGLLVAQTCNVTASTGYPADVQTAINSASAGQVVCMPAGTWQWPQVANTAPFGVTLSGITLQGAGSSRVIAVSSSTLSLATGSQTLTIIGTSVTSPTPSITTGQTLTIAETGNELLNYMSGTVTSYNSGTGALVMNLTAATGTCGDTSLSNCARWLVITAPSSATKIINNNNGNTTPALFTITESTTNNTYLSNFEVDPTGSGLSHIVYVNYVSGGMASVIHDCRMSENANNTEPTSGDASMMEYLGSKGLVYNCSFESTPYNPSTLFAVTLKDGTNSTGLNSWTTVSNMGNLDTTGLGELFFESNDYHAMGFPNNNDDNGRMVARYSFYDNSGLMGTHGADTSQYGQRYFEAYNNVSHYDGYSTGLSFNVNDYFYVRGGTYVVYNNTLAPLPSTDYPTAHDFNMTAMNLNRNGGPDPCWGSYNATPTGQDYFAPRQVGFGYVTGVGHTSFTYPGSPTYSVPVSTSPYYTDSVTYVGDSEPAYAWDNSRTLTYTISDYTPTECTQPDTSQNYIVSGRDFFDGSTAKPGWAPYTFPHPLEGNPQASTPTFSPVAGTYSSAQSVSLTCSTGPIACYNTTGSPATNGTTGCTTGTLYSSAISVPSTETLYAVCGGAGYSDSTVGSALYTITGGSSYAGSFIAPESHASLGTAIH